MNAKENEDTHECETLTMNADKKEPGIDEDEENEIRLHTPRMTTKHEE